MVGPLLALHAAIVCQGKGICNIWWWFEDSIYLFTAFKVTVNISNQLSLRMEQCNNRRWNYV